MLAGLMGKFFTARTLSVCAHKRFYLSSQRLPGEGISLSISSMTQSQFLLSQSPRINEKIFKKNDNGFPDDTQTSYPMMRFQHLRSFQPQPFRSCRKKIHQPRSSDKPPLHLCSVQWKCNSHTAATSHAHSCAHSQAH